MAGYVIQFAWGWVVLAALVGWGGLAGRLAGAARFGPDGRPDWGLACGWGMALVLAAGGVLALAGVARPPVLIGLVLAGAALFARDLAGRRRRPGGGPKRLPLWLLAVVVVPLVARYAGAVHHQALSCSDDNIAYFAFVARLLDTGTLIEPYSLRRLSAFGGQTFLQALVVAAGTIDNAYLIDRGVAFVAVFGLVAGIFKAGDKEGDAWRAVPCLATLLLVVILPFPLLNSSSHVTGLAMFLTLYRTLELTPLDDPPPVRRLWLIGGVAAAAASLKATFIPAAVVAVAAYWLLAAWRHRRHAGGSDWRRLGRSFFHVALAGLLVIGPWMALLWRSSGTPFYPLIRGHHRPEFAETYTGAPPAGELAAALFDFLIEPRVWLLLAPLALHVFRRGNPAGLALYAGALAASVATVVTLVYDDGENLRRYVAPFLYAAFMATLASCLDGILRGMPKAAAAGRRPAAGTAILAVVVALMLPAPLYHDFNRVLDKRAGAALGPDQRAVYRRVQAAVPPGARMLVAVGHPFALDFGRNDIVNIDVPGAVSPDPGMPFFRGPAALKAYLLGQSIAHVAFRDFDIAGGCLYNRGEWRAPAHGVNPMWRAQSKYYLDLMDNLDGLAGSEKVLYRERGLTVVALR